ncbi:PQQ-dependent sugar dehydrogenase [Catellatospora sp. NPDC049609]|uniref:PQQ-dependent sugar dehydrogenase n=1 Tax=Catellatospora sp. NPDC049609 TaxID=3155505 RepID=UPI003427A277
MHSTRRRLAVLLAATLAATAGAVAAVTAAQAAAGCRVTYTVSSQWTGGFGATVSLTNLGDPVSSWQVGWSFGAGQTITQLWNGTHTQSGAQVTVRNAAYNGSLATGASTAFGFNGSWTGSNPVPTVFTMNGVTCTGAVTPSSAAPSSPPPADTQPPTVPGNPRISNLTCNSVTFAWNAATDNVGVAFYDIYHDGQQMTSVSGSTLSANLTVVAGATWGLYVNARDAAGNVSQASTTVTITPPQCQVDTTAPTAPSQLAGTAAGTTVTLRWTAATDDVGVRAYDVYRGGALVGTVSGNPPATTFIDSGLAANTAYQYHVTARDAAGNTSPRSNTATVTTTGGCTVCTVTQVATDTDIPWGLATLADGSILYSRRDAHDVIRLNPTTGAKTTLGTVPNAQSTDGEGGLLGIAVAPDFASNPWLYVMHTSPTDNRIVRMRVVDDRLDTASLAVLVSGIGRNKYHDGGRLRFGPDGKLYAATGDAQNGNWAQDRNRLEGKILRLNADGTVPADNPFGNLVWSYGHRNPQGLAFDAQGRLWQQEFGNSVMDETNLIERGGNYGWPACEGTTGTCGTAGFIAPKRTYPTSEGSCSGIAIVRDALYVACLRGARLYRAVISGTSLTNVQSYFVGTYGRLRTVEPSPTGGLWLTTSNTGDKDSVPDNSNERILHVALG